MQGKTERFEMRIDSETLGKIDDWRAQQVDLPSRAEAFRRLVETALSSLESKSLQFSDGEKLILSMLCELHKHHKMENNIDPSFVEDALLGGHYWALESKLPGIFHGHEDDKAMVREVGNILEVWWFVEMSHSRLSEGDKDRVTNEAKPFGERVVFPGFDGNYETKHLSIATFLINKLDRFVAFKGRDLNSHVPLIDCYRRMVKTFEPIRPLVGSNWLDAECIILILNAQRPERVPNLENNSKSKRPERRRQEL